MKNTKKEEAYNPKKGRKTSSKFRKISIIALVSLLSFSISGTTVYLSMQNSSKGNADDNVVVPDDNDINGGGTSNEESNFSKTMGKVMDSSEIYVAELDVVVNPGSSTNACTIKLKNVDVDLSKINSSIFSLSANLEIVYGKFDQSMTIAIEDDTYAYISYLSGNFRVAAPKTIDDAVKTLQGIGVTMPSISGGSTSVSSIITKVTDVLKKVEVTGDATHDFDINLGSLTIDSTTLANLDVKMHSDDNNNLTGLEVGSLATPVTVSQAYTSTDAAGTSTTSSEKLLSFYLSTSVPTGSTLTQAVTLDYRSYVAVDASKYTDVTDPNSSVFTSIAKIFSVDTNGIVSAKANIGLGIGLDKINTDNTTSAFMSFDGGVAVDSSDVSKLLSNSKFLLTLNNRKTANTTGSEVADPMDTLKAYYEGGSTGAAYINLNDSIKAQIPDATSKELIDYVADADGGQKAITVIASQLGKTLDSLPIDEIKQAAKDKKVTNSVITKISDFIVDYTGKANDALNGMTFTYDSTKNAFIFTIASSAIGLTTEEADKYIITATVNLNTTAGALDTTSSKGISSIVVSGLKVNGLAVSVTLAPKAVSEMPTMSFSGVFGTDAKTSDYASFEPATGIFRTLGNYVANKKGQVNYSLTFLDKTSDTATKASYIASGTIGVDMTKVTSIQSFNGKDANGNATGIDTDLAAGNYYLGMTMNTGDGTLSHDVKIAYQEADSTSGKHNLYLSYNDVFKNYVSDASMSDIITILNQKTGTTNSSDGLAAMENVLSLLKANQTFIDDLKAVETNHTIKGLTSFVGLANGVNADGTADTTKLVLTLNTDKIFTGTSLFGQLNALTITIDTDVTTDADGNPLHSLASIEVTGLVASPDVLNFKMTFPTADKFIATTVTDTTGYTEIVDASSIVNAFYNLPTQLKTYGLKIDADMTQTDKTKTNEKGEYDTSSLFSIGGTVKVDGDNGYYGGTVHLYHDSLANIGTSNTAKADQKIEFQYKTKDDAGTAIDNPQFVAEYNDRMHILMHKNTVKDLINTVSEDTKSHTLLESLDTVQNVTNGLPIVQAIADKNPSLLLKYQYVYKVSFDDKANTITLYLDRTLFDKTAKAHDDSDAATMTITYDDTTGKTPSLTSVKLNTTINTVTGYTTSTDANGNSVVTPVSDSTTVATTNTISAMMSFVPYANVEVPTVATTDDGKSGLFIDLDSAAIKTLLKSGVETTDYNYYNIAGNANIDLTANLDEDSSLKLEQYSFDLGLNLTFFIADNTVYTDINVNNGQKASTQDGYSDTEFRISGESVYVSKTSRSKGTNASDTDGALTSKNYKTTKAEVKSNWTYFVLSETLDIDSKVAGRTLMAQLYKALGGLTDSTSSTQTTNANFNLGLKDDFSGLISSLTHTTTSKATNKYSAVFDLGSLLSDTSDLKDILSFGSGELDLYDQTVTASDGTISNPFYAVGFNMNVGVVPYTKSVSGADTTVNLLNASVKASLHSRADNDMWTATTTDEVQNVKNTKMGTFFKYISTFDSYAKTNNLANYDITSYTLKTKELYDFTNWKLTQFTNDYVINDNASAAMVTFSDASGDNAVYFRVD
jgi:hypothetical protein